MRNRSGRPRGRRVLLLEAFDTGSHRAFARGWAACSRHHLTIAALPARFWKWRLRGAAFTFAERLRARLQEFDAVVATSMLNAADFAAAVRLHLPLIVYAHENQLSYPRPEGEPLDHGLALASIASAAAADAVVFNSRFHRDEFARGLEEWMVRFPEHAPRRTARAILRKSTVIPPGIDWEKLAPLAHRERRLPGRAETLAPLILWNHRWEFDKNAPAFFWALDQVERRGRRFRLALLGDNSQFVPKPFLEAKARFGDRIVHYGFVPSEKTYRSWLGRADLAVSTARQENFGIAVAEAVAAGAFPLLPHRLSYPGLLPERFQDACLYRSQNDLVRRLDRLLAHPELLAVDRLARSRTMSGYDWPRIAARLDALIDRVALASL